MADQSDLFPTAANTEVDDVIIIGGGLAGLFCALKLAPRPVTVLAAAPIGNGASSAWAQAGIAAAVMPGDTVEKHVADTVAAGAGLVDEAIARLMASEASDRIHDLLRQRRRRRHRAGRAGRRLQRPPADLLGRRHAPVHLEPRVAGQKSPLSGRNDSHGIWNAGSDEKGEFVRPKEGARGRDEGRRVGGVLHEIPDSAPVASKNQGSIHHLIECAGRGGSSRRSDSYGDSPTPTGLKTTRKPPSQTFKIKSITLLIP